MLFLVTYHFSKGDPHRGCAGFNYDTEAAMAHTQVIRRQMEQIFGAGHATIYPLICGIETDEDTIIVHGSNGEKLDLSLLEPEDKVTLQPRLAAMLPDMPPQMRADLLPLLLGNLDNIARVREQAKRNERLLDIEHREWMICVGRGFDFLHTPNLALIIGPYSPNLDVPIGKAGGIIQANMRSGRIPDDGFALAGFRSIYGNRYGSGACRTEIVFPGPLCRRGAASGISGTCGEDARAYCRTRLAIADD